jgi:ketosteroid isomerase-like protein
VVVRPDDSEDLTEFVKRHYAALNRSLRTGDVSGVAQEFYSPEIIGEEGEEGTLTAFFIETPWIGHAAALEFWDGQLEVIRNFQIEPSNFVQRGDEIVFSVMLRGAMRHTELVAEAPFVNLWTVRHGRLVRWRFYRDRSKALAAIGAAE